MSKNRKTAPDPEIDQESPLKRIVKVETIRHGQEEVIEPTEAELKEIASLQDLKSLERLLFTYTLRKASGGSIRLKGRLEAKAIQTCVVTLEPVDEMIDMPVEAEFWPLTRIHAIEREEAEAGSAGDPLAEWPEPIVDGTIDLGRLVYETFALALTPYPRREGAAFEWEEGKSGEGDAAETRENPFAVLEQLKRN
ncbi:YceD family protein [Methyloligella solikamskensis]|uniref:YceD family protein n=1 Tax=Methyloligella solikamskensis TaxID=1177756 RepID=A0ABW3JAF6_9HYPH